jgi:probable HAF family extracellular repeat protein
MTDLGTIGGFADSEGLGINASGQIAGESGNANGRSIAFLYSNHVMTGLGTLPGYTSSAGSAINGNGDVAGNSSSGSTTHAFLYHGGAMIDLGLLPGTVGSYALGINDSDQVVGNCYTQASDVPFLYQNGVMTNLNSLVSPASGWSFSEATGINDLGQITGIGGLNGQPAAFLMTPIVPEPSTRSLLSVAGLALVGLAISKRRARRAAVALAQD